LHEMLSERMNSLTSVCETDWKLFATIRPQISKIRHLLERKDFETREQLLSLLGLLEEYYDRKKKYGIAIPEPPTVDVLDVLKTIVPLRDRIAQMDYDSFRAQFQVVPSSTPERKGQVAPRAIPEKKVQPSPKRSSSKVFVVHGHDEGLRKDVELLLHEFGLDPVVLHKRASGGNTVIEKIETHGDVDYAIILLTPDDEVFNSDQGVPPGHETKKTYRARQNVVFEWGYFIARLKRENVCSVLKGPVEIPSDLLGLVHIKIKNNISEKAIDLERELRKAGFTIRSS